MLNKNPKQVVIPQTTPTHYITGKPALNLQAPEGTSGDWHFFAVFYDVENTGETLPLTLAGEGEFINTNQIFGQYGIYECSAIMREAGLYISDEITAVYAANHLRAILDLIYRSLIKHHEVIALDGATEDWLDTEEQKAEVLHKAIEMIPYLSPAESSELQRWISKESLPGYRS